VFRHGIDLGVVEAAKDPTLGLRKLTVVTGGHVAWTEEQIAQYFAEHPPGTRAHLAASWRLKPFNA
jgi:hypothetical protein